MILRNKNQKKSYIIYKGNCKIEFGMSWIIELKIKESIASVL
jgi:hypothetical protein